MVPRLVGIAGRGASWLTTSLVTAWGRQIAVQSGQAASLVLRGLHKRRALGELRVPATTAEHEYDEPGKGKNEHDKQHADACFSGGRLQEFF